MKTPRRELAKVIAERTLSERDPRALARTIAAYLLDEHRTAELEPLLRDVMQYRLEHGSIEADVVSVHELSRQVEDDLKTLLKAEYPGVEQIIINQRRDPELIGGLRIDLPNEQLDDSVRAKLSNFKQLIAGGKG
jgi:F-type H+-transporting ATPase subunit delta